MKDIVIETGVYGHRTSAGRVQPVARGERVAVPDEEAARLVALGVASYADAPTTPPAPPSGGLEPHGASQNAPEDEPPAEAATDGEKGDSDASEVKRLERMPKADLEQMAQDMGVDISGAKNNRERAELLAAAMPAEDGDDPLDIEDEDIVR